MQFQLRETTGGAFAKKGTDIKNGDKVTIKDEGKEVEGKFGVQNVFQIQTQNGEFSFSMNSTSINSMIKEWGTESKSWIGKQVNVISMKQNVQGNFIDVYYLAPDGYEFTENGLVKQNRQAQPQPTEPTIPPAQPQQEAQVKTEDIPF